MKTLWEHAQRESARNSSLMGISPMEFRIQQTGKADFNTPCCILPIIREWRYAGKDIIECSVNEPNAFKQDLVYGSFYHAGNILFYISDNRKQIVFNYVLGPHYGRGYILKVAGQGASGRLIVATGTNQWIS